MAQAPPVAQQNQQQRCLRINPGGNSTPATTSPQGGPGGAANADFDSLIDLITSTIANETWAETGGGEAEFVPSRPA